MTRQTTEQVRHSPLSLYTACAEASAGQVIADYSTSFGTATRLFDKNTRPRIRSIYGLVRIADEIVDGAAEQAGLTVNERRDMLEALADETTMAIRTGYSTNLVVHAFAATARTVGISAELVDPFFASMRRDTDERPMRAAEIAEYIHGSAEVIGLMCLKVFLVDSAVSPSHLLVLEEGARHLGAAFQKINFLRDLGEDVDGLGRNYFPDVDPEAFTDADKFRILDDIEHDLAIARAVIPALPSGDRAAVAAAARLFTALCDRARATPAAELRTSRVSVSTATKIRILLAAQMIDRHRSIDTRRSGVWHRS